jgi:hypothetical protein
LSSSITNGQSELIFTSHEHSEVLYIDSTDSADRLITKFASYIGRVRRDKKAVDVDGVLRDLLGEGSFFEIDLRTEKVNVPGYVIETSNSTASFRGDEVKVTWSRFSNEFHVRFGSYSEEVSWPKFIRRVNFSIQQSSIGFLGTANTLSCIVRSKKCENAIIFEKRGDRIAVSQRVFIVRDIVPSLLDIDSMVLNADVSPSLGSRSRMIWHER